LKEIQKSAQQEGSEDEEDQIFRAFEGENQVLLDEQP